MHLEHLGRKEIKSKYQPELEGISEGKPWGNSRDKSQNLKVGYWPIPIHFPKSNYNNWTLLVPFFDILYYTQGFPAPNIGKLRR